MPRKMISLIGAIAVFIATCAIPYNSIAQAQSPSTTPITDSSLPTLMFIHGYTKDKPNYDLEHCFVQDESADEKRPLYFNGYTDVMLDKSQIDFKLFNLTNGKWDPVAMPKKDWDVKTYDYMFTITIKGTAAPHLGPGPYMATISVGGASAKTNPTWRYFYGTWKKSSSTPLDCLNLP